MAHLSYTEWTVWCLSPAGMRIRPSCWQLNPSSRLFSVSQWMFLYRISAPAGWTLHASRDSGRAEDTEQLHRLDSQVTAGRKKTLVNKSEGKDNRPREINSQLRRIVKERGWWKALKWLEQKLFINFKRSYIMQNFLYHGFLTTMCL